MSIASEGHYVVSSTNIHVNRSTRMKGNIQYREVCWRGKQNRMREMQRGSIHGTFFVATVELYQYAAHRSCFVLAHVYLSLLLNVEMHNIT